MRTYRILHRETGRELFNGAEESLQGANLVGANLVGANLRGADLVGANLSEAVIMSDWIIQKRTTGWPCHPERSKSE